MKKMKRFLNCKYFRGLIGFEKSKLDNTRMNQIISYIKSYRNILYSEIIISILSYMLNNSDKIANIFTVA